MLALPTGPERLALRTSLAAMPEQAVFTSAEAAVYCGTGGSTWERMRRMKLTPPAIRLTGRTLGYRKRELDAWLDRRSEKAA